MNNQIRNKIREYRNKIVALNKQLEDYKTNPKIEVTINCYEEFITELTILLED